MTKKLTIKKLSEVPKLPELHVGHGVEMTKVLAVTRSANNALDRARKFRENLYTPNSEMQNRPFSHHFNDAQNIAVDAIGVWLRASETLLKTLPFLSGENLPDGAELMQQHEAVSQFWRDAMNAFPLLS